MNYYGMDEARDIDFDAAIAQAKTVTPQSVGDWAWQVAVLLIDRLIQAEPGTVPGKVATTLGLDGDWECWQLADVLQGVLVDHSDVPPTIRLELSDYES